MSTPQASSSWLQMHCQEGKPNSLLQFTSSEPVNQMMKMMKLPMILRPGSSIISLNLTQENLTEEETAAAYSILGSEEISVITWERLYEVANEDQVLVKLKEVV